MGGWASQKAKAHQVGPTDKLSLSLWKWAETDKPHDTGQQSSWQACLRACTSLWKNIKNKLKIWKEEQAGKLSKSKRLKAKT